MYRKRVHYNNRCIVVVYVCMSACLLAYMYVCLIGCLSVCPFLLTIAIKSCWTSTKDVHGFGGKEHRLATLGECQETCVGDSNCVAVDWEPSNPHGKTCWILKSTVTGPTTQPDVITHYELLRDCIG